MSARCSFNETKRPLSGHKVSHSNIKTKRRFEPNLQHITMRSEVLGQDVRLRLATNTIRSIEHNGGLDEYLLSTSTSKLGVIGKKLKKAIVAAKAV